MADQPLNYSICQPKFYIAPGEDETLYSVVSRYHLLSGNTAREVTRIEWFGNSNWSIHITLPRGLEFISDKLKHVFPTPPDILLEKLTIFPYYNLFVDEVQASRIRNIMYRNDSISVNWFTGNMRLLFNRRDRLKYCPQCVDDDVKNFGCGFWHRSHLLPFVSVCHIHGCRLKAIPGHLGRGNQGQYMMIPPEESLRAGFGALESSQMLIQNEMRFAGLSKDILTEIKSPVGKETLYVVYRKKLIEMGLVNANRGIDRVSLVKAISNKYSEEYLAHIGCSLINRSIDKTWVARLLRPDNQSANIHHILMIGYCFKTIKELNESIRIVCSNAALRDGLYNYFASKRAKVVATGKPKRKIAVVFIREIKEQLIKDADTIYDIYTRKSGYTCPVDGGSAESLFARKSDLENIILFLAKTGVTLTHISKLTNISIANVSKAIMKDETTLATREQSINNAVSSHYVNVMESAISRFPGVKRHELATDIKYGCLTAYQWMRNNNNAWLDNNMPIVKSKGPKSKWAQIDAEMSEKINIGAERVKKEEGSIADGVVMKIPRVTENSIYQIVGISRTIKPHLAEMPLTRAALEAAIETDDEYLSRRIQWAIRKIIINGDRPTFVGIKNIIRLPNTLSPEIMAELNDII